MRPVERAHVSGPFATVFSYLSTELNFTYGLWRAVDLEGLGNWGKKTKDGGGLWTGLVGAVQRGRADMCVTGFSVTSSRYQGL